MSSRFNSCRSCLSLFTLCIIFNITYGRVLNQIGRLYIPNTGIPGAENAAIDLENERIFVADGYHKSVYSMDFSIDSNITNADIEPSKNIFLESAFLTLNKPKIQILDITCVAMNYEKGYIISTIVPLNHSVNNGWLAFIDPTNQTVFNLIELDECFLPDHVTTTYSGNIILVSCEGEPSENESQFPKVNPPGSVGYINVTNDNMNQWEYININFTQFDYGGIKYDLLPDDIYIPLPENEGTFSLSAEPEHIVVDFDDKYAYICLQESNAIGILDINNQEIINIFTLGYAYFGNNGGLDASDKDGKINIVQYANLYAMRQPDDIDYYKFENGRQFLFTANEGDGKGFDESRVKNLVLDEDSFGDENHTKYLQSNGVLGRLKVSNLIGDTNISGFFNELYMFSSRDFTVFEIFFDNNNEPMNISLHFSSNNDFERIISEQMPIGFNANYYYNSFDDRSDAKGPEPEGITIGICANGRKYVFICLERIGGIMAYDFSDINNISFVDYYNNRNWTYEYNETVRPPMGVGDIGPEQMRWIDANIYGEPLLVVSHPQSASVTMYKIDCGESWSNTTTTNGPQTTNAKTTTNGPQSSTQIPQTTNDNNNNNNNNESESDKLTSLEIIAIAIGSFALLSIIFLVVYIICKRKNANGLEQYKYNSINDFDNSGKPSGHYFELEK